VSLARARWSCRTGLPTSSSDGWKRRQSRRWAEGDKTDCRVPQHSPDIPSCRPSEGSCADASRGWAPHKAKACRPRAVHSNTASSSDGEQTLSDDDADVLTVSSSVSGTPQSAAVVAPPLCIGVPGSPEPSQLISSFEAFNNDDASLADSLSF
jgi:hypothetical protein